MNFFRDISNWTTIILMIKYLVDSDKFHFILLLLCLFTIVNLSINFMQTYFIHMISFKDIAIVIVIDFWLTLYLQCYLFVNDFINFLVGHWSIGFVYQLAWLCSVFSLSLPLSVKIHQSLDRLKMKEIPDLLFRIFFELSIISIKYFFYKHPCHRLIYMIHFFYHCFKECSTLYSQYFSYEGFLLNSYYLLFVAASNMKDLKIILCLLFIFDLLSSFCLDYHLF